MSPTRLPVRSWLYVPGHRPDLARKALDGAADAVVLDLEDAVPADRKAEAREGVRSVLGQGPSPKPIWVRLSGPAAADWQQDLPAVAQPALAGLRLPKAETPAQVAALAAALAEARAPAAGLHCLLESALGVENAFQLASEPSVTGIGLGEADLAADLGVGDQGLLYARSRCVNAARAASIAAPVQSVYTDLRDDDGLAATTRAGRALGFVGRSAVHPRQITVIHDALRPSDGEIERAREIVAAMAHAGAAGSGTAVLPDGRFADAAVEAGARRTLALAGEEVPA